MRDPAGLLLGLALAAFLVGEALALLDPSLGATASERVRRWAGASVWRRLSIGSGDGLIYFDGASTITAAHAAITVNSATSITITVEGGTTQYATPSGYHYGVKYLDASGYPSQASIGGVFTVEADIPKAVS